MQPTLPPPDQKTRENLRLISIFHYVLAGVLGVFSCFPLIHVTIGVLMVNGTIASKAGQEGEVELLGYFFIIAGTFAILFGLSLATAAFVSGRMISRRKKRTGSIIIAGILCLFMPLGTLLGIITIVYLTQDSTLREYEEA